MSDSEFAWATVHTDNPLTVRRDGETEPIGVTPQTLIPTSLLSTGNRVWCQFVDRRALILGRSKGVWPIFWGGVRSIGEIAGDGGNYSSTITLPSGVFSAIQNIIPVSESPRVTISVDNITTESFRLRVYNWTSSSTPGATVRWTAIGR